MTRIASTRYNVIVGREIALVVSCPIKKRGLVFRAFLEAMAAPPLPVVIDGRNMVAGSSSGNRRSDIAGSTPAVTTFFSSAN